MDFPSEKEFYGACAVVLVLALVQFFYRGK